MIVFNYAIINQKDERTSIREDEALLVFMSRGMIRELSVAKARLVHSAGIHRTSEQHMVFKFTDKARLSITARFQER